MTNIIPNTPQKCDGECSYQDFWLHWLCAVDGVDEKEAGQSFMVRTLAVGQIAQSLHIQAHDDLCVERNQQ